MASTSEKSSSVGMPQLDFSNFDNQAFWLLIFLFLVFLVIRLLVMPRMEETLTNRRKIIEEGIQEAEDFRDKAVEIENSLNDGFGFLHIQIPNWSLDAAPSRPIFYQV